MVIAGLVVERAARCRECGAVDLEHRVGRFDFEGFGPVRWCGEAVRSHGFQPRLDPEKTPFCVSQGRILAEMSDVTRLLDAIENGDSGATEALLPLVYDELRRLAARRMAQERPGQTLDATALVHEAYLRLVQVPEVGQWNGRGHFFAAAAEAMRRILVENARRKSALKHGGQWQKHPVTDVADQNDDRQLLALDDALTRLAAEDCVAAKVVEMHHFGGLSHEVVADSLGLTVYRVRQKWTYAQVWLRDAIEP